MIFYGHEVMKMTDIKSIISRLIASVGKMLFYCPFYCLDYKKAVVDFLDEN